MINLHEEVVRLDVPVDEVLAVDVLDPRDQLVRQQQHCLQAEPPATTKTVEVGFCLDKCICQFGEIRFAIWTNMYCN